MNKMIVTVAASTALMLSGCAKYAYVHPEYSGAEAQAQLKKDSYECDIEIKDMDAKSYYKKRCLEHRGWRLEQYN